jgi:hypothetical protein
VGIGPDATKNAAVKIIRKIAPLFRNSPHHNFPNSFDHTAVLKAIRAHWLPRVGQSMSDDVLSDVIEAERDTFEAAQSAKQEAQRERWRLAEEAAEQRARDRAAEEEAALEARLERTEKIKEAADVLKCSTRYVRMLLAEKTTLPSVAAKLAQVFGSDPAEHLKPRARSGRNPNLIGLIMRPYVKGASFADFIEDPPELSEAVRELRDKLAADSTLPDHVRELEPLATFAQSAGIDTATAMELWNAYKPWRLARFMDAATEELADPFDFG